MTALTWERCKPGASPALVADVESTLGVRFPSAYRELVQRCQGGVPRERMRFQYRDPVIGTVTAAVGALLTLDPQASDSISTRLAQLAVDDQLPAAVIPFADVGNGDLICFDFRHTDDDPPVAYWSHGLGSDDDNEEGVLPLASSFAAFLAMLQPRPGQ